MGPNGSGKSTLAYSIAGHPKYTVTSGSVTLDGEHRKALYDRVQAIMAEYQPIIGLASPHILVGADAELRNFRPGILPPYTLWNADELFFERQSAR